MFNITQEGLAIKLQSATSIVEILPVCGAILNRWQVQLNNRAWEVIEGYDSPEDFSTNCESKGFRSTKLSPYVCRIPNSGSYNFNNKDYKVGKFNLLGSNIHGLLYNEPFEVAYKEASEKIAMLALHYHYRATDTGYPFNYFMEIVYHLMPDNVLKLSTTVYNQHTSSIPIADGWHPYFKLGRPIDDLFLEMASDKMLVFDKRLVPTGDLKLESRFEFLNCLEGIELDHCFILHKPLIGPACSLVNQKDGLALHITPENNYPFLQVYTPPHRKSIAIENLSSAPNAFNNKMGLLVLKPDEQITFTTSYQITEWK